MSAAVQAAVIAALRALPVGAPAKIAEMRRWIGCTPGELAGAIQSLRYQGKLEWARIALSPSMIEEASGSAMPEVEGGAAAAREVAEAAPPSGPDDDDDYPGEVNDAVPVAGPATPTDAPVVAGPATPTDAGGGFVPRASLHKAGTHAAATRAGAKPCPPPEHEPEIARLVREEANENGARRSRARSTGTVRVPLELKKFGVPDMSFGEGVASLLAENPNDLMAAISRKHPLLWKRVLLLGRAAGERPAQALYAALEAGLEQLETQLEVSDAVTG